ncbi:MAG: alpha/beta hydrolase, partial [Pseudomonadota bacterium]
VVGHSFGGTVALAWALERPDNIAALVPLSAPSNPWEGGLGVFYDIPSSSLGGGLVVPVVTALANEERLDIAANVVFYPQEAPEGYADYVGAGLAARRETLRANARQVSQLKPQIIAMTQLYDRIDVPTEILHGTADETVPIDIHSDILLTQIPGARLMRLAGIGHMPHHVAADEVEAAIDRAASRARLR